VCILSEPQLNHIRQRLENLRVKIVKKTISIEDAIIRLDNARTDIQVTIERIRESYPPWQTDAFKPYLPQKLYRDIYTGQEY
jgi:hypothetical protein